jgi:hypothetical protein
MTSKNSKKTHAEDRYKRRIALAKDKRVTITALILELLIGLCFVLLVDAFIGQAMQQSTLITSHVSWHYVLAFYLVLQYALVAGEIIASRRVEERSWTIPLVFLPFGNLFRIFIMLTLELTIIIPKLLVYFTSVLLSFPLLLLNLSGRVKFYPIDIFDKITEPLEMIINRIYNALYYNKIKTRANVFNAFFNNTLSFWCINH